MQTKAGVTPRVLVAGFQHVSAPQFQVTATFAEPACKTRLTFQGLFETAAKCAKVKGFAVEANEQMFDRLEAELARMA